VFIQDCGQQFSASSGSCLMLCGVGFAAGYVGTVVYLHSLSFHWTVKSICVEFAQIGNGAMMG
jgi:hypothetical protein